MGDESVGEKSSTFSYKQTFYEVFPTYLSLGMTYDQFFRDDPWLVKFYREAGKIKSDEDNFNSWLLGRYVFEAVSTAIYNAFGRDKGKKAEDFRDKPYELHYKPKKEEDTENEIEREKIKARLWMESLVKGRV